MPTKDIDLKKIITELKFILLNDYIASNQRYFDKEDVINGLNVGSNMGSYSLTHIDGTYEGSLQLLIHHLMYLNDIYPQILNEKQLERLEDVLNEAPEELYQLEYDDEDWGDIQECVLDVIQYECIRFVGKTLIKYGYPVQEIFQDYLTNNYYGEDTSVVLEDIDGNKYHSVVIGDQEWIIENWKSTKYADGIPIPNVTDNDKWKELTTAAYCWYNNDPIVFTDGTLYNGYIIHPDNEHKIAPDGWRVPSKDDWNNLIKYLCENGYAWDGSIPEHPYTDNKLSKALASDRVEWWGDEAEYDEGDIDYKPYLNNKSGFAALPSGNRYDDGSFGCWCNSAYFLSSDLDLDNGELTYLEMYSISESVDLTYERINTGVSIRLMRDVKK